MAQIQVVLELYEFNHVPRRISILDSVDNRYKHS